MRILFFASQITIALAQLLFAHYNVQAKDPFFFFNLFCLALAIYFATHDGLILLGKEPK